MSSRPFTTIALTAMCLAVSGCGDEPDGAMVVQQAAGPERCTPGERRCLDGDTPELCVRQGGSGRWQAQADCAGDTPICAAGVCVCSDGSEECAGGVARVCVAGAWETETCEVGCLGTGCAVNTVSAAGILSCDPANALYCEGATPYCTPDAYYSQVTCESTLGSSSLACDGPSDCPPGYDCCKGDYVLCPTRCRPAGTCGSVQCFTGTPDFQLCDPTAPACPAGTTCQQVPWMVSAVPLFGCK